MHWEDGSESLVMVLFELLVWIVLVLLLSV